MTMIILGSGNVAWHLTKAFREAGVDLIQIYGRNEKELLDISQETGVPYSVTKLEKADFYLICTSDQSVAEVSKKIKYNNVLVAHTAGSLPKEVLQGGYQKACFYPLQTFSKHKTLNYSEIPFFIDTENEGDERFLIDLGSKISQKVLKTSFEQRQQMHLAAVFACNFVNHLYAEAEQICQENKIPAETLYPLILETAAKVIGNPAREVQTGPAKRRDQEIIQHHERLIKDPEQLKIYKILTESIIKMYE